MTRAMDEPPVRSDPVKRDEDLACDTCGRFGAIAIGDRRLCDSCYEAAGSCGPGGAEDE